MDWKQVNTSSDVLLKEQILCQLNSGIYVVLIFNVDDEYNEIMAPLFEDYILWNGLRRYCRITD